MLIRLLNENWRIPLLFQSGVLYDCTVNTSVWDFLKSGCALSPEYIEKQLETVFLNGQPLDDLRTVIVRDGDRLALARGLPGVAGACMRRGSPLNAYRSGISAHASVLGTLETLGSGRIELALFGLLMKELYLHFLQRGVLVQAGRLREIIREEATCRILIDGKELGHKETLENLDGLGPTELLKVSGIM